MTDPAAMIGGADYWTHTFRHRCKDALGPSAGAVIAVPEGHSAREEATNGHH